MFERPTVSVLFTITVAAPVHFLGGVGWPWALVIGVAVSMVLRAVIHGWQPCASRPPPPP